MLMYQVETKLHPGTRYERRAHSSLNTQNRWENCVIILYMVRMKTEIKQIKGLYIDYSG